MMTCFGTTFIMMELEARNDVSGSLASSFFSRQNPPPLRTGVEVTKLSNQEIVMSFTEELRTAAGERWERVINHKVCRVIFN